MIQGIDVATGQANLDFNIPWAAGHRACYVKLGGDNVPRYIAPYYTQQVDKARTRGYTMGHYWVPDARQDPVGAADFYVNNLRGWTVKDFAVLDNESFDNDPDGTGPLKTSLRYTDAQVAAWVNRVKARKNIPGSQVLVYSGWYDAAGTTWTQTLATGAMFLIADYRASSQPAFNFPDIPTIPRNRIVGHQTGAATYGGVDTDVNGFLDTAFTYTKPTQQKEEDMKVISVQNGTIALVGEFTGTPYTAYSGDQLVSIQANRKAYGEATGFTEAEAMKMVGEARQRYAKLVADVTSAVIAALPDAPASGTITDADIAKIAEASSAAVDRVLGDDFAALPAKVVKAEGDALSNG